MPISLAALEGPLTEARAKLHVDVGGAGQILHALGSAARSLRDYSHDHQRQAAALRQAWRGARGDDFGTHARPVAAALEGAAGAAAQTASTVGDAVALLNAAQREVDALMAEFEADAAPLVAAANGISAQDRGVAVTAQAMLQAMAARYGAAAAQVVHRAKQRLAEVADATATTPPAAAAGDPPDSPAGGGGGGGGGTGPAGGHAVVTPPSTQFGSGTQVNLPAGMGTVTAPNERAAIAVRAALGQLGVPYQWGGTRPGQGLDCSGLTQYAYGQAGIGLDHYSGSQTVGQKIDAAQLAPGDLVVWRGHVAMYVGDGKMIEEPHTGAVCHIVPLRTSNAGDPFLGCYRPSA